MSYYYSNEVDRVNEEGVKISEYEVTYNLKHHVAYFEALYNWNELFTGDLEVPLVIIYDPNPGSILAYGDGFVSHMTNSKGVNHIVINLYRAMTIANSVELEYGLEKRNQYIALELISITAHEFCHLLQMQDNRLKPLDNQVFRWEGQEYDISNIDKRSTDYLNLPWETEAYYFGLKKVMEVKGELDKLPEVWETFKNNYTELANIGV